MIGSPAIPASSSRTAPRKTTLIEVGWEVANPVGGIYQVLRSKAATMGDRWGRRYLMLGPWFESKSTLEIEVSKPRGWLADVTQRLADRGVAAHSGRWLVAGHPKTFLVDPNVPDEVRAETVRILEQDLAIPTQSHEPLVGQIISFAAAVREFLIAANSVINDADSEQRIAVHFHEWLSGLGIPLAKHAELPLATAFTTHATMLGRYLASSQEGFDPTSADYVDADGEAHRMGITAQHQIERACAHGADVFTTVSAVTADECKLTLGREPDHVTPNGLNVSRFSVGHDFQTLHAVFKERIEEFVMGHFFPSYSFDLAQTRYFFTSGRFEPRNKGFDLCLEALARLNSALKATGTDLTVVFFIITQRPTRSLSPAELRARGVLQELHDVCKRITSDVGDKLFHLAATRQQVKLDDLVEEYWGMRLKRTQAALKANHDPAVCTHVLESEHDDGVLNHLKHLGLANAEEDRVKIVYSPEFITPTSPIWGIEYDQFVRGCHLGLFPSTYEPWGYTPQECLALGVPAVTSDLAGFGRFAQANLSDQSSRGKWAPYILSRRGRSFNESAAELAELLLDFCSMERGDRVVVRNDVEKRSWDFDWSRLGGAYHVVHDLALERLESRRG
ncbi:MAG: glycogen synthase [Planctomycetota bacterium]